MNLFVVWPHVQPENGPPRMHTFHIESQELRRAAFFHPLAHEIRDSVLLFRHFLRHQVSSLASESLHRSLSIAGVRLALKEDTSRKTQYTVTPPSTGIAAPV